MSRVTKGARRRRDLTRRQTWAGLAGLALLAVIAWISYVSSQGLPWEGGYELTVEMPNAERLIAGNEVAIAGRRVGRVDDVDAVVGGDGRSFARATVKIESGERLPADTTAAIRPDSVLGASYVELRPGRSSETLGDGDVLPLRNVRTSTELNDVFKLFDSGTRRHLRSTLRGLGDGLAGRGRALNTATEDFSLSMDPLRRFSAELADPRSGLDRLIRGYASFSRDLAAAADRLPGLVSGGADTAGAVARQGRALDATLARLAPAERAATTALVKLQPALDDLARTATDLRPAGRLLPRALRRADATLRAGIPAMRGMPRLATDLDGALTALRRTTTAPATSGALRKTREFLNDGARLFEVLRAGQVNCNAFTLWARNLGDLWGGTGAGNGPSHALLGLKIAQMGALGEVLQSPGPSPNVGMNYVSNNNDEECEAGNEPYTGAQSIGNTPGLEPKETFPTAIEGEAVTHARESGLLRPAPWGDGR